MPSRERRLKEAEKAKSLERKEANKLAHQKAREAQSPEELKQVCHINILKNIEIISCIVKLK